MIKNVMHKIKRLFPYFIIGLVGGVLGVSALLFIVGIDPIEQTILATPESNSPLFKSGFEPSTRMSGTRRLEGPDNETGFTWGRRLNACVKNTFFYYGGGVPQYADAGLKTVIGPQGNDTTVLSLQAKDNDPSTSVTTRSEYSIYFTGPPNEFQEGHVSYWMKIDDSINDRGDGTVMVVELKEAGTDNVPSYRSHIYVVKDGAEYSWRLVFEQIKPRRVVEYREESDSVDVIIGEWFFVEMHFRKHVSDGRFWYAVNGETVFDYHGRTENINRPEAMQFWSIFKIYDFHDTLYPLETLYDDVELSIDCLLSQTPVTFTPAPPTATITLTPTTEPAQCVRVVWDKGTFSEGLNIRPGDSMFNEAYEHTYLGKGFKFIPLAISENWQGTFAKVSLPNGWVAMDLTWDTNTYAELVDCEE